jgi:hypothetical protein
MRKYSFYFIRKIKNEKGEKMNLEETISLFNEVNGLFDNSREIQEYETKEVIYDIVNYNKNADMESNAKLEIISKLVNALDVFNSTGEYYPLKTQADYINLLKKADAFRAKTNVYFNNKNWLENFTSNKVKISPLKLLQSTSINIGYRDNDVYNGYSTITFDGIEGAENNSITITRIPVISFLKFLNTKVLKENIVEILEELFDNDPEYFNNMDTKELIELCTDNSVVLNGNTFQTKFIIDSYRNFIGTGTVNLYMYYQQLITGSGSSNSSGSSNVTSKDNLKKGNIYLMNKSNPYLIMYLGEKYIIKHKLIPKDQNEDIIDIQSWSLNPSITKKKLAVKLELHPYLLNDSNRFDREALSRLSQIDLIKSGQIYNLPSLKSLEFSETFMQNPFIKQFSEYSDYDINNKILQNYSYSNTTNVIDVLDDPIPTRILKNPGYKMVPCTSDTNNPLLINVYRLPADGNLYFCRYPQLINNNGLSFTLRGSYLFKTIPTKIGEVECIKLSRNTSQTSIEYRVFERNENLFSFELVEKKKSSFDINFG